MPGFGDSAFIVLLALLLFGPKKLPVLARQLGKLMADFRRASNEFRTQMEEELRISEQAERQKQLAAAASLATPATVVAEPEPASQLAPEMRYEGLDETEVAAPVAAEVAAEPAPIAVSDELSILPPATGLPVANTSYKVEQNGAKNGAGAAADAGHEAAGGHQESAGADHKAEGADHKAAGAEHIAAGVEHEGALETETLNG
jgi:sec-independent protein translocase protein TatB